MNGTQVRPVNDFGGIASQWC